MANKGMLTQMAAVSKMLFTRNPSKLAVGIGLAFCLGMMLLFVSPMFANLTAMQDDMDWYGFGSMYESYRKGVLDFHQFPLRTFYLEGGYPMIGFPYDISLSPFSLVILIFGSTPGMKIMMVLAFLIGAGGMFYLLRSTLELNLGATIFGTIAFSLTAWLPMQVDNANVPLAMAPFLGIWAIAFYLKALKRPVYLVAGAIAMVQVVVLTIQSTIPLALFLGVLCVLYVVTGIEKKAAWSISLRPVWVLVLMALLTGLFAAPKLIAIADFETRLVGHVHIEGEDDYPTLEKNMIAHYGVYHPRYFLLLLTKSTRGRSKSEIDIYSLYQGWGVLVLAMLSLALTFRISIRWGILLAFLFCFNLGPYCPVNLYEILWHLFWPTKYIWKIVKYFGFYLVVPLSVMAGAFFEAFTERRRLYGMALLIFFAVVSYTVIDTQLGSRPLFRGLYTKPMPPKKELAKEPFGQIWVTGIPEHRYNDLDSTILKERHFSQYVYLYLLKNIGTINWPTNQILHRGGIVAKYFAPSMEELEFDALPITNLVPNTDYRGEAYFAKESTNKVRIVRFTPNVMVFETKIVDAYPLIVNQNYHDHFRVSEGELFDAGGPMGIRLPEGEHRVVLRFVPIPFYLGLLVSVISIAGVAAVLLWQRKKRGVA